MIFFNMIKLRKMCSGVFMDGKFYVIGGIGGNEGRVLICGEEFDFYIRIWKEILNMFFGNCVEVLENDMFVVVEVFLFVVVVNNELYVVDYVDMELKKYNKEIK